MANHQAHVVAAAERWPEAWRRAHTNGPGTEDFIRLLASFLHHEVDPNVGLNGKRGNPDDISDDALAVFDQSGDVTDRSGRRMIIVDCIVGAGGPDPRAGWASVGGPSPGAWVQPPRIHDAPPPGPGVPAPPATPDLAGLLKAIDAKLTTIAEHSGKQAATQERLAAALGELVTAVKALKP